MTWAAVLLLTALYVALMLKVAFWMGGLLHDAEAFLNAPCTCTRYRLCAGCLASLRDQAGAEDPAKLKEAREASESR